MKTTEHLEPKARFEKVGECLYRYSSNGVYYALLKHRGKQKRTSLETTDRAIAKRKLSDLKRDFTRVVPTAGRIPLKQVCERYLATIQHQKAKTVRRKEDIVASLLEDFPLGPHCMITKVTKSSLEAWLATYTFGYASYNLYLQAVKAIFQQAIDDHLLTESPAQAIRGKKRPKPIRITPTFDEFQKIVNEVRAQRHSTDAEESANLLEFMGLAGVGQAEAGNLIRNHIDFVKERIKLCRVKTSFSYEIPLFPQLHPLFAKMKVQELPREELLFSVKDAKRGLQAACKRLNFPTYSQRSFRRMFITRCIELGIDVKVIAQWQGHKDGGKLILATYSHVRKDHADEMAKKLVLPL